MNAMTAIFANEEMGQDARTADGADVVWLSDIRSLFHGESGKRVISRSSLTAEKFSTCNTQHDYIL